MVIDKSNLSKCKYVYRLYLSDDKIHCEQHPIIYIAKKLIYVKVASYTDDRLMYLEMSQSNLTTLSNVADYVDVYLDKVINEGTLFILQDTKKHDIFPIVAYMNDNINSHLEVARKKKLLDRVETCRTRMERLKLEYEGAVKDYEASMSTLDIDDKLDKLKTDGLSQQEIAELLDSIIN